MRLILITLRNDAEMERIKSWSGKIGIVLGWGVFLSLLMTAFFAVGGRLTGIMKEKPDIKIRFLQTENDADCIIISEGERGIMIDTGEKIDAKMILHGLEQAGITTLDYLILSHPDSDHIGGALEIANNISISKVIEPNFDGKKEELQEFNTYCKENGIPIFYPTHIWRIKTDYIHLIIYPSLEKHYKDSNNYSLGILAKHGKNRMFFAGDAKRKRLEELLAMNLPEVGIYKVPHHGRANSATSKMFEKLKPTYAVVTSDTADQEVWDSCEAWESDLLFTGEKMLIFTSDGQRLSIEEGSYD